MGSKLGALCLEKNIAYETRYGTVYRARFGINGNVQPWDIHRICIPLPTEKSKKLCERYGIEPDKLVEYNTALANAMKRHLSLNGTIAKLNNGALEKSLHRIVYREIDRETDATGSIIYYVTEVADPLFGSELLPEDGASLLSVVQVGFRLTQIAKSFEKSGIRLNLYDPAFFCNTKQGGNLYVKAAGLYAAETLESTWVEPMPQDILMHIPGEASSVKRHTYEANAYALASVLWTIFSGNTPWSCPNYHIDPPYAPHEITAALKSCINGDANALHGLARTLQNVAEKIRKEKIENIHISFRDVQAQAVPEDVGNIDIAGNDSKGDEHLHGQLEPVSDETEVVESKSETEARGDKTTVDDDSGSVAVVEPEGNKEAANTEEQGGAMDTVPMSCEDTPSAPRGDKNDEEKKEDPSEADQSGGRSNVQEIGLHSEIIPKEKAAANSGKGLRAIITILAALLVLLGVCFSFTLGRMTELRRRVDEDGQKMERLEEETDGKTKSSEIVSDAGDNHDMSNKPVSAVPQSNEVGKSNDSSSDAAKEAEEKAEDAQKDEDGESSAQTQQDKEDEASFAVQETVQNDLHSEGENQSAPPNAAETTNEPEQQEDRQTTADQTLSLSSNSVNIGVGESATVTLNGQINGTVRNPSSSNRAVATASISGRQITIQGVSKGDATISIVVDGNEGPFTIQVRVA